MNTIDRAGTDRFEDRLLAQLRADLPHHPQPGLARTHRRHRRTLLYAGASTAAAAVALAGLLTATAAGPAYAIDTGSDGTFTVVLYSTDAADVADAEQELRQRGARVGLVPATLDCLSTLDAPRLAAPPHAAPTGPPSVEDYPEFHAFQPVSGDGQQRQNPITGEALEARERAFTVQPDLIPAGEVLWVAVAAGESSAATLTMTAQFEPVGAPQPDFCAPS